MARYAVVIEYDRGEAFDAYQEQGEEAFAPPNDEQMRDQIDAFLRGEEGLGDAYWFPGVRVVSTTLEEG